MNSGCTEPTPAMDTSTVNAAPAAIGRVCVTAADTWATSSVARETTSPAPARSTRSTGRPSAVDTMSSRRSAMAVSARRATRTKPRPDRMPAPMAAAIIRTASSTMSPVPPSWATTSTMPPISLGTSTPHQAAAVSTRTATSSRSPRPRTSTRRWRKVSLAPATGNRSAVVAASRESAA